MGAVLTGASFGCSSNNQSFVGSTAASAHPARPTGSINDPPSQPVLSGSTVARDGSPALASPTAGRAVSYTDTHSVTTDDVIRWTSRSVREDVILDRIERSPSVFHLTAADENHLRDNGVSEPVIQEMKATARR
jgi:hypothetical protein